MLCIKKGANVMAKGSISISTGGLPDNERVLEAGSQSDEKIFRKKKFKILGKM